MMWLAALAWPADPPSLSAAHGLYDAAFTLTLTPADPSDTVVYSVDGSLPTVPYPGALDVSTTTVVRAASVGTDGDRSATVTASYIFVKDVLVQAGMDTALTLDATTGPVIERSLRELPTLSLVVPGGMTMSEQAVSVEWIDPAGVESSVDCGSEIIGGTSYVYPKTSFRLHFRSKYGPSRWAVDLYPDDGALPAPADHFDALTLRSGNHDSVFYLANQAQYTRNRWMDQTQLDQGDLAPRGRFAQLYVNGSYNGVYHIRERFDAGYLASYLGGEEEDYEAINGGSAFDGSGAAWSALLASVDDYDAVQERLDVENFLNYMVTNYYAANSWDWSYNHNWISAGPVEPGRGGFKFHSADSDICLVYDATTNILSNPGPSSLFGSLMAAGDEDFLLAVQDALHRNLEDGGPLTPDASAARYEAISGELEDAIYAEAARWGGGTWTADGTWAAERSRLMKEFFPARTEILLQQLHDVGWMRLAAPEADVASGWVTPGTVVQVHGDAAELWLTMNGEDPRESDGSVSAQATGPDLVQHLTVDHGLSVRARLRDAQGWGPLLRRDFEVDEPIPLLLNEWNAVAPDETLEGGDDALGTLPGNGGDWMEFLVLEDHLDLRSWSLRMEDAGGGGWTLAFTDDDALRDLRAGTLFTIAEDLPEDVACDPAAGDWRFHLRAADGAGGEYVSARDFDVTADLWRLSVLDAQGLERVPPIGEGLGVVGGISAAEVGLFAADPDADTRTRDLAWRDGDRSTFGAPNRWSDGEQDLSTLRGEGGGVVVPGDTGAPAAAPDPAASTDGSAPSGCGCAGSPPGGWLAVAVALTALRRRGAGLLLLAGCGGGTDGTSLIGAPEDQRTPEPASCHPDRDRDGYGDPAVVVACGGAAVAEGSDCDDAAAAVHPEAPELCDGEDDDCDGAVDSDDPDLADGLPFYTDGDGDGYGTAAQHTACELISGLSAQGGDCDDTDAMIHPGAVERCDAVDDDCDGAAGDALGLSAECPTTSCAAAAAGGVPTGSTWIDLPSGTLAEVWCDQDREGGGWTLGFTRNSAATTNQADFGSGEVGLDALATEPGEASRSAAALMGWLDLNDYPWTELRVGSWQLGVSTWTSASIPRSELLTRFGEAGYKLYGGTTGYYWCGGDHTYTDLGQGAVNNPAGAPPGCKYHGSLGSGWDFSESAYANAGLTLCGADQSAWMSGTWGGGLTYYGTSGAAQVIWVR